MPRGLLAMWSWASSVVHPSTPSRASPRNWPRSSIPPAAGSSSCPTRSITPRSTRGRVCSRRRPGSFASWLGGSTRASCLSCGSGSNASPTKAWTRSDKSSVVRLVPSMRHEPNGSRSGPCRGPRAWTASAQVAMPVSRTVSPCHLPSARMPPSAECCGHPLPTRRQCAAESPAQGETSGTAAAKAAALVVVASAQPCHRKPCGPFPAAAVLPRAAFQHSHCCRRRMGSP
mmetsp:Transcript_91326/g.195861  ORF Transcript_91326/g.195861 Transcript_91326/m.195861 type:complete len:230 (+) Transcript_91326:2206-2895(+)